VKALFDTNILIDYLNGINDARKEIERYETVMISAITWMEVMVGAKDDEAATIRAFLSRFIQLPVNSEIAERAVTIRRQTHIRLPDAIIWASAKSENALLVSRNSKDFPPDAPGVRLPYLIGGKG
jgi:predicted nucleic acid-binding protein